MITGIRNHRGIEFPAVMVHCNCCRVQAANTTLRDEFADAPLFVHDPRICRILPFWLHVLAEFGAVPGFVLLGIL